MSNTHPKIHVPEKFLTIARSSLVVSLLAAGSCWSPAFGVAQDSPTVVDGIKTVCTGVGESKNDPRWSSYPLRLVFSNDKGQYIAGENIDLVENGHTVVQASCDAPWLLLKPAAGTYRVMATLPGPNGPRRASAQFTAKGKGPQQTITLDFPAAQTG